MSNPELLLQKWIVDTLKAAETGVGDNVFDSVPDADPYPRITIGQGQTVPGEDDGQCGATFEVYQQIDVWSRKPGYPEVKAIAGQVRAAIHGAVPTLTGFTVVLLEVRSSDTMRDPDGITSRARIQIHAFIDEA